jgi:hypothetical protein
MEASIFQPDHVTYVHPTPCIVRLRKGMIQRFPTRESGLIHLFRLMVIPGPTRSRFIREAAEPRLFASVYFHNPLLLYVLSRRQLFRRQQYHSRGHAPVFHHWHRVAFIGFSIHVDLSLFRFVRFVI